MKLETKELKIVDLEWEDEIFSETILITSKKNPNLEIHLYVSECEGETYFNIMPGDSTKLKVTKCDNGMSYRPSSEYSEQEINEENISIV